MTSSSFDSADMASRGRLGGLAKSARYDAAQYTQPARNGFLRRFYQELPAGLSQEEADRRARAGLKLHMQKLARRSALKRRKPETDTTNDGKEEP
jgi:hypothetical protein